VQRPTLAQKYLFSERRRAAQRYTCLAQDANQSRYLYESLSSDFKAELWVDAEQLISRSPSREAGRSAVRGERDIVLYEGQWEHPAF